MAGNTATYYHNHPEAYKRKLATDKRINARPEQREKRSFLVKKRREDGRYGNRDGKDYDHKQKRYMSASKNRGQHEKSRVPGYRAKMKK